MIKIFRLKLELLRKRFHIYGFFNVASLLLVLFLLVGGAKYFIVRLGHYEEMAWLMTIFYFTLFAGNVFAKEIEQQVVREQTFFTEISPEEFRRFEQYKKWVVFYLIYLYLIFPTRGGEVGQFICFCLVEQGLLFVLELAHKSLEKEKYLGFRTVLSAVMCLMVVAYARGVIAFPSFQKITAVQALVLVILNLFLLKWNYRNLEAGERERTHVYFLKLSKRIPFLRKNKNLLFLLRKNVLFDVFLLLLLSSVESPKYFAEKSNVIVSYGITFLVCLLWVYCELLNSDSQKLCAFIVSPKQLKKEAMRDVGLASLLFLVVACLGNFNRVSILWIVEAYLGALLAFVAAAFCVRTTAETGKEKKQTVTGRETGYLYVVSLAVFFLLFHFGA